MASRKAAAQASPESGPVTLRVLADHLGLSPASVSLVLNQAPGAAAIPRATQERIVAAARKFNYRPNTLARSLRRQRSFTIGVLVPEISEGYATLVLRGIEDRLLQEGFLYFVASHRHRRDLLDEYPRLLLDRAVEGLIAIDTPCERVLPVPIVAVSGRHNTAGVTNVILNHDRAATLALKHLQSLGHRRIAVIKGQTFSSDTYIRWRAIRNAATRLNVMLDRQLVVQLEGDGPLPEAGYDITRQLLRTRPGFTAIFAFNDLSAFGAIGALRDANLQVPDDVSVVGFDDILSASSHNPPLTTVRQPLRQMGEIAAETMVKRIAAGRTARAPRMVHVEPELIVRASTAKAVEAADVRQTHKRARRVARAEARAYVRRDGRRNRT
jgi:DNA-binding LacI/PurR family transcriptional regulator